MNSDTSVYHTLIFEKKISCKKFSCYVASETVLRASPSAVGCSSSLIYRLKFRFHFATEKNRVN